MPIWRNHNSKECGVAVVIAVAPAPPRLSAWDSIKKEAEFCHLLGHQRTQLSIPTRPTRVHTESSTSEKYSSSLSSNSSGSSSTDSQQSSAVELPIRETPLPSPKLDGTHVAIVDLHLECADEETILSENRETSASKSFDGATESNSSTTCCMEAERRTSKLSVLSAWLQNLDDDPWAPLAVMKRPRRANRSGIRSRVNETLADDCKNGPSEAVHRCQLSADLHRNCCFAASPTLGPILCGSSALVHSSSRSILSITPPFWEWVSRISSGHTPECSCQCYPSGLPSCPRKWITDHQLGSKMEPGKVLGELKCVPSLGYSSTCAKTHMGGTEQGGFSGSGTHQNPDGFGGGSSYIGNFNRNGNDQRGYGQSDNNGGTGGKQLFKVLGGQKDNLSCPYYKFMCQKGHVGSHQCVRESRFSSFTAQRDHVLSIHIAALQCEKCYSRFGTHKARARHQVKCQGTGQVLNKISPELVVFSRKVENCKNSASLTKILFLNEVTQYDKLGDIDNLKPQRQSFSSRNTSQHATRSSPSTPQSIPMTPRMPQTSAFGIPEGPTPSFTGRQMEMPGRFSVQRSQLATENTQGLDHPHSAPPAPSMSQPCYPGTVNRAAPDFVESHTETTDDIFPRHPHQFSAESTQDSNPIPSADLEEIFDLSELKLDPLAMFVAELNRVQHCAPLMLQHIIKQFKGQLSPSVVEKIREVFLEDQTTKQSVPVPETYYNAGTTFTGSVLESGYGSLQARRVDPQDDERHKEIQLYNGFTDVRDTSQYTRTVPETNHEGVEFSDANSIADTDVDSDTNIRYLPPGVSDKQSLPSYGNMASHNNLQFASNFQPNDATREGEKSPAHIPRKRQRGIGYKSNT